MAPNKRKSASSKKSKPAGQSCCTLRIVGLASLFVAALATAIYYYQISDLISLSSVYDFSKTSFDDENSEELVSNRQETENMNGKDEKKSESVEKREDFPNKVGTIWKDSGMFCKPSIFY